MTTPTPTPDTDELLSAVLDGDASAEEEARVLTDPALVSRLGQLRAAAAAVAEPVTWPADAGDPVATALARTGATADHGPSAVVGPADARAGGGPDTPTERPGVVDNTLDARRAQRVYTVLGAAAAVVIIGLVAVAITSSQDDTVDVASSRAATERFEDVGDAMADAEMFDGDMADEADLFADDEMAAGAPEAMFDSVDPPVTTTTPGPPPIDLGGLSPIDSRFKLDTLAAEVADLLATPAAQRSDDAGSDATVGESTVSALAVLRETCAHLGLGPDLEAVGLVLVEGLPYFFTVQDRALILYELPDCEPSLRAPLPR
ncbi:MAG: hypothetical protein JJU45_05215 [Acidimicrobiia bacterium]|nr:hypothetical protein [Acidimicrobiia bacterium]